MLNYKFEVICSFEGLESVRVRFEAQPDTIEEVFFCYIFNKLTDQELNRLKKMSVCQICENECEIFPFINECEGKIYLDNYENVYPIERRVQEYLNSYIDVMCN